MKIIVTVRPNSRETKIISRNPWVVAVAAPPHKGKANLELVKFLRKTLKKKVTIVSGARSKKKMIEIHD